MSIHLDDGDVVLHLGDCVEVMAAMPAESVDAVVCDPPYGLEFMGKEWDRFGRDTGNGYREKLAAGLPFQSWHEAWATEALRVLKPGGHLLAFGGTRTSHRLVCAIDDAGFEIRDSISYGHMRHVYCQCSPLPRPGEQLAGEPRAVAVEWIAQGGGAWPGCPRCHMPLAPPFDAGPLIFGYGSGFPKSLNVSKQIDKAAGAEREVVGNGRSGGGRTAMDGAPGCGRARDYLAGEYEITAPATPEAAAWDGWGTALKPAHEPVCVARKPLAERTVAAQVLATGTGAINVGATRIRPVSVPDGGAARRWPSNVILDEEAAALLDEAVGERPSSPSRFFYTSKASRAERDGATHPTVKPLDLMRWLVRLVTPPGGVVLDPFAGSGTTLLAARQEGFRAIGIEREPEYAAMAAHRLRHLSLLGGAR